MAPCTSCSLGKLIATPSLLKVEKESHVFHERIQGDICRPVHPPFGPFRYFMVLIDASSSWSYVLLLSTHNMAFAKFLAQIIKLRAHFPDYTVKRVRLDNVGEFTSQSFNDYYMSVGIVVEHLVAHVHTQNGLAESLIKHHLPSSLLFLLRCGIQIKAVSALGVRGKGLSAGEMLFETYPHSMEIDLGKIPRPRV
ncbi:disease resistance CC-NBS-LRR class family protein [Tanacetum coccineum]